MTEKGTLPLGRLLNDVVPTLKFYTMNKVRIIELPFFSRGVIRSTYLWTVRRIYNVFTGKFISVT